ncbi:MAG: NYN domain-containing protein [Vicinamibacterales bacterium]
MKIAVLIDFDNIEIGVKTTLNREFDVGAVLDAVKERGEVITKIAYGDWKRAGDYSRMLTQHAVRMVQRNMTPGGDKNGADINLALDALEMAFTHDHINAFVIVGGDSDFISLVEKLKQYDKKVFVVGGRQFTGAVMQKNCHEFIAYENLIRQPSRRQPPAQGRERGGGQPAPAPSTLSVAPVSKAFPLVTRALGLLTDREVTPQLGLLKSTLLQLDSTFSERDYGASSFRDFAEKLAEAGLVALRSSGRSVLVELKEAAAGVPEGADLPQADVEAASAAPTGVPAAPAEADALGEPRGEAPQTSIVDGIRLLQRVLVTPGAIARWPMYVRNVKQAMRAADPGFDERKHGNLVEILRSVQRDGVVRLDRDRQGVLRVFQGPQLRVPVAPAAEPADDMAGADAHAIVDAAPLGAPLEEAGSGTPAGAPAAADEAAGAAAPDADAPVTGEPEAETPAAEAPPRRRRKAGAAAPRTKSTPARKPRARAATPRRKKVTETE